MDEQIVLVDSNGTQLGIAPKLESHHAHTPLHRAFSCYAFNQKGQFLLTQRALSKKVWPSVWTNSVCGHPGPGEDTVDAIKRRLKFELGIDDSSELQVIKSDYTYTTPAYNGIIENEYCPIYICRVDQEPSPNPDEVENFKWTNWDDLKASIKLADSNLSYWFIDQFNIVDSSSLIDSYKKELS